jgi:hypothetical protein
VAAGLRLNVWAQKTRLSQTLAEAGTRDGGSGISYRRSSPITLLKVPGETK